MKLLLTVMLALSLTLATSDAFASGWYKTSWGMSVQEIEEAVGRRLEPATDFLIDNGFNYKIRNFNIGDIACNIKLSIQNDKLIFVRVDVSSSPSFESFVYLNESLRKKYGRGTGVDTMQLDGGGEITSSSWATDTTIITVIFSSMILANEAMNAVYIDYKPRQRADPDKL